MKLLEAEITEYTTPIQMDGVWQPITLKIKQTDKNAKIVGLQLAKQVTANESETGVEYKFELDSGEWLLEGCWIPRIEYGEDSDSYMEIKIRYDNVTER